MAVERKVALVTGAGGAIGTAIAQALAAEGHRIVASDVDPAGLERAAAAIGGDVATARIDLGDPDATVAGFRAAAGEAGPVDILVNNAGILSNNKVLATSLEEWRRIHAVNIDAAFLLMQAALPAMIERRWGRIVNIASFAWKSGGLTSGTAYSSSKGALVALTFAIARETAKAGITVNGIAPAYVMSKMISEQLDEAQRQRQLAQIPVGRFCRPEEVAHTVRFLCSPLAGFITGEIIDMNGGLQFD
jgi:3-oxoacyl-[acyl-carrier protein] reductase